MEEETTKPFTSLSLPQKDVSAFAENRYRVYKDADNYVTVEAKSAMEALKASGMKQASRILRDSIQNSTVIDLKKIAMSAPTLVPLPPQEDMTAVPPPAEDVTLIDAPPEEPVEVTVSVEAEVVVAAPVIETSVTPEAEGERPLSNEEVEKLLNS